MEKFQKIRYLSYVRRGNSFSIFEYDLDLTFYTSIEFTIGMRHTVVCLQYNASKHVQIYLTFQTQIHLHKQCIFDTNNSQREYAFLFPLSINILLTVIHYYALQRIFYIKMLKLPHLFNPMQCLDSLLSLWISYKTV